MCHLAQLLQKLLRVLNKEVSGFTGSGKAPMEYALEKVISHIISDAHGDQALQVFCSTLLRNMKTRLSDKYVAYRKVRPQATLVYAVSIVVML